MFFMCFWILWSPSQVWLRNLMLLWILAKNFPSLLKIFKFKNLNWCNLLCFFSVLTFFVSALFSILFPFVNFNFKYLFTSIVYYFQFIVKLISARRGNNDVREPIQTPTNTNADLNENVGTGTGTETETDSTAAPLPQTDQRETLLGDELWTVQLSQRLTAIYENGLPIPTVRAFILMWDFR